MRYPYSSVLTEDGSGDPETTLDYIVLGYDAQANEAKFPTNDWDDLGYGLINFKATWGDFYYPNYTPTAISYQYQITALGANSAADAAIITNYSYQEIFGRLQTIHRILLGTAISRFLRKQLTLNRVLQIQIQVILNYQFQVPILMALII